MSDPTLSASIIVGHENEEKLSVLKKMLDELGHRVQATAKTAGEMLSVCRKSDFDLIVSEIQFPDGDAIETLIEISHEEPKPSIIVTKVDSLERVEKAMDDHVMAYLIDPVSIEELKATIVVVIRRFEQFNELRSENKDLRESLDTRKRVERAKGILMEKEELSEEDAYLKIRRAATDRRIKMREVAEEIIAAEDTEP